MSILIATSTMSEYSVYQQLETDPKYTYKLLQLPPAILEKLSQDDQPSDLFIKSDINSLVLCTDSQTFKLRQMNHSNTVLLMNKDQDDRLVGFLKSSYEYELSPMEGTIDISNIPIYDGRSISPHSSHNIRLTELEDDSLCSHKEFFKNWCELGGCEIDEFAYVMSVNVITDLLFLLITKLMSLGKDGSFTIDEISSVVNNNYNSSMLTSIIHRFATTSSNNSNQWVLNDGKITKWFGIHELSKTNNRLISQNEFLLNWKTSLPSFYNPPLDIVQLQGHYCSPMENKILYIDPNSLSENLAQRFKELFELDKKWNYDEFIPFILKFVPLGKKVDSVILKYGKKKKIGKDKFIVCPR